MSFENNGFNITQKEEMHPALVLVILLVSAIGSVFILGSGLTVLLLVANGYGLDELASLLTDVSTAKERNIFRTSLLIQHLTMFVLPALVVAYFVYKQDWRKKLSLDAFPSFSTWGIGILIMVAAIPLVAASSWLNLQIPLPEWASSMEEQTQEAILQMLKVDAPYELLFNLFLVGVIPAIGEELIFRGFLQKRLEELVHNPHTAVWIAAFIFSTIHFQFEGFLPRMLLGALLGYLLVWTKNLWVPMIAHFFFNASQVLAQYFSPEDAQMEIENISEMDIPMAAAVIGVLGSLALVWWLAKQLQARQENIW